MQALSIRAIKTPAKSAGVKLPCSPRAECIEIRRSVAFVPLGSAVKLNAKIWQNFRSTPVRYRFSAIKKFCFHLSSKLWIRLELTRPRGQPAETFTSSQSLKSLTTPPRTCVFCEFSVLFFPVFPLFSASYLSVGS